MEFILKKEEIKERLDMCRLCPSYSGGIFGLSLPCLERCTECGCFLKAKSTLKFAECPKGKWK